MSGWIGVDLDGTLSRYEHGDGVDSIGAPVPAMVQRIREWLNGGIHVRIVTARVGACQAYNDEGVQDTTEFAAKQRKMIEERCYNHIGISLPVTCSKDFEMIELWDDRAIQVIPNTGLPMVEQGERSG